MASVKLENNLHLFQKITNKQTDKMNRATVLQLSKYTFNSTSTLSFSLQFITRYGEVIPKYIHLPSSMLWSLQKRLLFEKAPWKPCPQRVKAGSQLQLLMSAPSKLVIQPQQQHHSDPIFLHEGCHESLHVLHSHQNVNSDLTHYAQGLLSTTWRHRSLHAGLSEWPLHPWKKL